MDDISIPDTTTELSTDSIDTTTTDESTVDTGAESAETSTEGTDETAGVEAESQTEGEQSKDEPAINGTKLSEAAKKTLDDIRKTNPKLAADLKNALFAGEALKKEFGGIQAIRDLKTTVEQFGGADGLKALKSENDGWNDLDSRFTNADPKFVEDIAESSPESFVKLVPSVFQKFQQLSPSGFSKYVGEIFLGDMMAANIPMTLERLSDFIDPQSNPKAAQLLGELSKYLGRIDTLARQEVKPLEKKQAAAPEVDAERQKFEQERTAFTQQQWTASANETRVKSFNSAWAKATTGVKLSTEQQAAVKELYLNRLQQSAASTPDFKKNVEAFFRAGDKEGYLRYMASFYNNNIPKAIQSAVSAIAPSRKPGPKPGQQAVAVGTKTTAEAGHVWTGKSPEANTIDWSRTSRGMMLSGKAVLKDGKKVQWKK